MGHDKERLAIRGIDFRVGTSEYSERLRSCSLRHLRCRGARRARDFNWLDLNWDVVEFISARICGDAAAKYYSLPFISRLNPASDTNARARATSSANVTNSHEKTLSYSNFIPTHLRVPLLFFTDPSDIPRLLRPFRNSRRARPDAVVVAEEPA